MWQTIIGRWYIRLGLKFQRWIRDDEWLRRGESRGRRGVWWKVV